MKYAQNIDFRVGTISLCPMCECNVASYYGHWSASEYEYFKTTKTRNDFTKVIPPGLEPGSSESESDILSIEL